ncbi:uncharacterized protein A4U43_C08F18030 [Asparagus officinalis]|nr:uncharacterized protein A4U43_C08F18030 [Asparagus officinalis]
MAVSFKGIMIDISKDSWFSLKAAFPHLVDVPSLSPKEDSAIQISSSDSKDHASSSDIPPGFEPAKKKSKQTKKKASSSNPLHRPFRKHLAMLKKVRYGRESEPEPEPEPGVDEIYLTALSLRFTNDYFFGDSKTIIYRNAAADIPNISAMFLLSY